MNYCSPGKIEIGNEEVGEINKAEIEGRGAGQLHLFRQARMMMTLFMAMIWYSAAWAQSEAGHTVATIPAKEGELRVQIGKNNDVWLVAGHRRVSLGAEEAIRVAAWIKERKMGRYGDLGSVRFRRESDALVVTLVPKKAAEEEFRLGYAAAAQLAAALASVRENVSAAGR
jgi:hypothetical protein